MVVTDLSEQKRNDEMIAAEGLALSILEQAAEAIVVCDVHARVLRANRAAHELCGDDPVLRPFEVAFPLRLATRSLVPAPFPEAGTEQIGEGVSLPHLARGVTILGVEVTLRREDGREFSLLASAGPLLGAQDQVLGCVVTLTDVTRRQRAEEGLLESEARFRRLAENAPDVIYRYELSPLNEFSYVSPAAGQVVGYAPEEYYADADLIWRVVHPEDRSLLERMFQGQTPSHPLLMRWQHKDGHTVWVEQRTVLVIDDRGNLAAIEGVARDVTERKLMEEQMLRAKRLEMAGQIAGQVAHDFNNLLSPLAGYPELIKMRLPPGHPAEKYCDEMLLAARQMAAINEELLTLARRGRVTEEPTDVNRVVVQAVEGQPPLPGSLVVQLDLAPDLLPVKGSSAQLLRVFFNLISNARDAMHDEGHLGIRTENVYVDRPLGRYNRVEIGEYVRVEVSDTGCGIPPEIKDRIFDPFFTTKRADHRRGSGLGLSAVQAIVDDHRGYVDLESEVGRGTVFSIYLPVHRGSLADAVSGEVQGGSETVLVVDDDGSQLRVTRQLLETLGYEVSTAGSGEDAVAYLQRHSADLLVLDMVMPGGIDGVETYRRVLETRHGQRTIVVSGFAESERVREALALGAATFLRKPVTLARLSQAIRQALDRAP